VLAVLHGEPRRIGRKHPGPSFETPRKGAAPQDDGSVCGSRSHSQRAPFIKMKFSQTPQFRKFLRNQQKSGALLRALEFSRRNQTMKKTAITLATVAALGAAAVAAPTKAEARGWGWGPGIGLGLAAGVVGAGLAAATWPGYAYGPGYYGPGYGYYGPRYYRPAYYGGPYAYYGGPRFYRHRYWRHRHHW
jgi:hypothetical protein